MPLIPSIGAVLNFHQFTLIRIFHSAIVLLISCGYAYSYTSSLLPQVQQGRALCHTLIGQAGQLFSPQVSGQCQQAQDFGPMLTAAVPITAVLAILGFMLGVYGAWINPKPKVVQASS